MDTLARACSFLLALLHQLEIGLLTLNFLSDITPSSFCSELFPTIASQTLILPWIVPKVSR